MSGLRRKVFSVPGISDKQFPAVVNSANLLTAGFAEWNAATGFTDPIGALALYGDNMVIPLDGGGGFPTFFGEYAEFPGGGPCDPTWVPLLHDRRDFVSALFDFRRIGFAADHLADIPFGYFELWPWEGTIAGSMDVRCVWNGGTLNWEIQYRLGGGAWVAIASGLRIVDLMANIIKINCARVTANQKSITITYYDSTVGWVTTAPILLNGAGLGDGIMIASYGPIGTDQGISSSTFVSYTAMKNMVCKSSNIDHLVYAAANPLPQM